MSHLVLVNHFCNEQMLESIYSNNKKKIGVISNLSLLVDGKAIGKIALIQSDVKKKLHLDSYVQFNPEKTCWHASKFIDGEGFYLVDSYWIKDFKPDVKIDVPVKVYDPKTQVISIEIQKLTFSQFIKRRLLEETGQYKYIAIRAYENFSYLMSKTNDYYFALNSTIKHYHIDQTGLTQIISFVSNCKKKIKKEWNELLNEAVAKDQAVKAVATLYKKSKSDNSNVVPLSKNSSFP